MDINADFNQPALVHAADLPWVPSPMPGIDRRMLDRIGDEVARATSIVRYVELTPGAQIKEKASGGIELFVLSGGMTTPALNRWSWLRLPPGQTFAGQAGAAGARIWIKTGHLRKPPRAPQASA